MPGQHTEKAFETTIEAHLVSAGGYEPGDRDTFDPVRGLKEAKPRTDASVNPDMAILGHMLSKAVEWDMLETSPCKKGKRLMFKENNHRLRFLYRQKRKHRGELLYP